MTATLDLQKPIVSPEDYGCELIIDGDMPFDYDKPIACDVETDEKDNFVGLALCQSEDKVYYYSELSELIYVLPGYPLIFQGGVFDLAMLRKWGINIRDDQYIWDTKILAYLVNPTLKKYGLKNLAKQFFDIQYPTYKEMVGTGKKKITLDKQPIERVAKYCGMDALITYKLYRHTLKYLSAKEMKWYKDVEFPLYSKVLAQIQKDGVCVDKDKLLTLHKKYGKIRDEYGQQILSLFDASGFEYPNKEKFLNSPKQIIAAFAHIGDPIKSSNSMTLKALKCEPAKLFLKYRNFNKAYTTYTGPLLKEPTLPKIPVRLNQNTDTGRLSSKLHCIPRRKEDTKEIREMFIPPPNHDLLVLDYSQIETRFLAHFSKDPVLVTIFNKGQNIHTALSDRIGVPYDVGKTCVHGMTYGATEYSLHHAIGRSVEECRDILNRFWEDLYVSKTWIATEIYNGYKNNGVETIGGRFRKFYGLKELKCYHQFRWNCDKCKQRRYIERQMISTKVQGSASDLIKKAMIQLYNKGYRMALQIHDELIFYIPHSMDKDIVLKDIKNIMENAIKLDVPIIAKGGYGRSWAAAK